MAAKPKLPKPFELIAGHPALDLVNTLDNRFDPEKLVDLIPDYVSLLRFTHQSSLITDRQLRKLRRLQTTPQQQAATLTNTIRLRESLAAIIYAQLDHPVDQEKHLQSQLTHLETVLKQAASQLHLTSTPTHFEWTLKGISRNPDSPFLLLAQAASQLLTSPELAQLRACASPACRWLFLDISKNHSRRWCDMKICGNRNKARLFLARQSNA